MTKTYTIQKRNERTGAVNSTDPLTLEEAHEYFNYTLEKGASWSHEKGNKKINLKPKTIKSLISNLNNAVNNAAANGYAGVTYFVN
jgi:mannosyltransferase OCH1-like enzyme